jgi:hypothetical protein
LGNLLVATILLNELADTWSPDGATRLISRGSCPGDRGPYLRFIFRCEDTALELKVFHGNWTIEIEASKEWTLIEWDAHSSLIYSNEAAQHDKVKASIERQFTQYTCDLILRKVTAHSIIEKVPLLYFEKRR